MVQEIFKSTGVHNLPTVLGFGIITPVYYYSLAGPRFLQNQLLSEGAEGSVEVRQFNGLLILKVPMQQ